MPELCRLGVEPGALLVDSPGSVATTVSISAGSSPPAGSSPTLLVVAWEVSSRVVSPAATDPGRVVAWDPAGGSTSRCPQAAQKALPTGISLPHLVQNAISGTCSSGRPRPGVTLPRKRLHFGPHHGLQRVYNDSDSGERR